jgi:3-oxoacyl-[acyl-carrier protein] reductase
MSRLEGKVVLITGAGSGIGKSTAELFSSEGATIIAQDIDSGAALETVKGLSGSHLSVGGDVSNEDAVDLLFSEIKNEFEHLDILVNNAGISQVSGDGSERSGTEASPTIGTMSYPSFMRMFAVHAGGTFLCTKASVPLMGPGGSIVNLSSIAGLAGWGQVHYAAAKGAILGITRSLARELGPRGIRVNAAAPGLVETPMTANFPPERLETLLDFTPLGRIGDSREIAATLLFLASDDSSYITGQWISPNGGFLTS